jgi:hypothetical protein
MAKRFIDTELYKKPWYRKLPPKYKCLWTYILTNCTFAGIWEADFEIASVYIGEQIDPTLAAEIFSGKFIQLDNSNKWFINDFIKFQNGEKLNEKSLYHKRICDVLRASFYNRKSLYDILLQNPLQPLPPGVPLGGIVIVRVVEGEIVKEKERVKGKVKSKNEKKQDDKSQEEEPTIWPGFDDFWNLYDKKVDRNSCEAGWKKLTQQEKEAIMQHLPSYITSTPDKKFRKDPETYLNRKAWQNEIIQSIGKTAVVETAEDRYRQRLAKFSSVFNRHNQSNGCN